MILWDMRPPQVRETDSVSETPSGRGGPAMLGNPQGPGTLWDRRLLGGPEDCTWKTQGVSNSFRWYRTYYFFVLQKVVNCFLFICLFSKKYLFIWLHQVLVAASEIYFFQDVGLLIFVVACKIFSCSMMWDLVPWPEIEPRPPTLGARSQPLDHHRNPSVEKLSGGKADRCGLSNKYII